MTRAPYTNLDAEWLATLGETFIGDGDLETGMRLTQVAAHLQSLDTKLLTFSKDGAFAAGVAEGYSRIYARSNVLAQVNAVPVKKQMQDAVRTTKVKPRRVTRESAAQAKPVDPRLAHIKLEL